MMYDDDPLTNALGARRFPHGRGARDHLRGHRQGLGGGFDPLRSLGQYEVHLGRSQSKKAKKSLSDSGSGAASSWMEIHELTREDDGLLASFCFIHDRGIVKGMCVLAGSRKGLAKIVAGLEADVDDPTEDNDDTNGASDSNGVGRSTEDVHNESASIDGSESATESDESEIDDSGEVHAHDTPSAFEDPDGHLERRERAFSKNTFRNPKFWIRWKGHVAGLVKADPDDGESADSSAETGLGYLVFNSDKCDRFDGTISCDALGWDNLKVVGRKCRPKGTACPFKWRDV